MKTLTKQLFSPYIEATGMQLFFGMVSRVESDYETILRMREAGITEYTRKTIDDFLKTNPQPE